jgi:Flp pilus assembly CpaE family ATPase
MDLYSLTHVDSSIPESLSTSVLSIALIGPDTQLRRAVAKALSGCHDGEICEIASYPSGLDGLPQLSESQHDVMMIELDSNPEAALDLVESICAKGMSTVMVYSRETDSDMADEDLLVRCMRAGAREFLSLPFSQNTMAEALVRAAARRQTPRVEKKAGGREFVFFGAKGGAGVTSLSCSFAVSMAQESSQSTLLIDLDLPLGDAAFNLGVQAQYSTVDALQNFRRMDSAFLSKLLVKHSSGLSVLAAPSKVVPFEVSNEAIDKLLMVARQDFENVVVDVGSKIDIAGTSLFKDATTIYLVTQAGVPELRNSNRLITQYFSADDTRLEIILNRYQTRGMGVSDKNIIKALTRPAKWKIPNDYAAVRRMQNTATSLTLIDSPISRQIDQIVRSVCGLPEIASKKKPFTLKGLVKGSAPDLDEALPLNLLRLTDDQDQSEDGAETDLADGIETRSYNGDTYVRGEDGQWHLMVAMDASDEMPTVTWTAPDPIIYGTPLGAEQLKAAASAPGNFIYTPGQGYMLPAGQHTLWVTFMPSNRMDAVVVQAEVPLTVCKMTPEIIWPAPQDIHYGTPLSCFQLNATASIAGTFQYSLNAGEILSEGQHTLSALFTPADVANYTEAMAEVSLVVSKPMPKISWQAPDSIPYGTALSAMQLNTVSSVPGTFDYSPSAGEVLEVGNHTLSVTFTPDDLTEYAVAQYEVQLTVTPSTPIIMWPAPASFSYGAALSAVQLNASSLVPGTFTYVPVENEVLPAGRHTLSVTFTPADSANYLTVSASVPLTIAKAKPAITWPAPAPITYGTPLNSTQLNAVASVAGSLVYIPSMGAVLSAGRHTPSVTFTPADTHNYSVAQLAIPLTVTKAMPTIFWPEPAPTTYGKPISATELNATASVPGAFEYSLAEGDLLKVGNHHISVTFTPVDATNYNCVRASVPLTVTKATPTEITWPPPDPIVYGTALSATELNATSSASGSFSYSPAEGTVLEVGNRTITATFTPDDPNLPQSQAAISLQVTQAVPVIYWPIPAPITYGAALTGAELKASVSVPGTMLFNPPEGDVLEAGRQTLRVEVTPTDTANYMPARAEVLLVVNKARPDITWVTPAPITYGSALSATQLNAKASVQGTFVYAPAAGTVLASGTQTLSVTFIPSNVRNYTRVQASVQLVVEGLANMASFAQEEAEDKLEYPSLATPAYDTGVIAQKRWVEDSGESVNPSDAPVLVSSSRTSISAEYGTESRDYASAPQTATQNAGSFKQNREPETRTYKGSTYVKGADGQWHLQRK